MLRYHTVREVHYVTTSMRSVISGPGTCHLLSVAMETLMAIVLVLAPLAPLVPLAACGPCPPGTAHYVSKGLCYWELTAQLEAAEAHALCRAAFKDGGLAFFPDQEAERFVIGHVPLPDYAANVSGQCRNNNGICNTHWIGHRDVWGRLGPPSLFVGTQPTWRPPAQTIINGTNDGCIQLYVSPYNISQWHEVSCTGSNRRSVCVTWAVEQTRLTRWRGQEGRTADSLLRSFTARSLIDCARQCSSRPQCASFNFRRSSRKCELTYRVLDPPAHPLTSDPGFRHYELAR